MSSARTSIEGKPRRDGFRDLAPVAGRKHDPLNAEPPEPAEKLLGARTELVGKRDLIRRPAIDDDRDKQRARRGV